MNGLTLGYLASIHRDLGHSCEINGDRQYVKVEPHDGKSPTLLGYSKNPPCQTAWKEICRLMET